MAAWKLLLLYAVWLLIAATIAIVAGSFVAIALEMVVGGDPSRVAFDVVGVATFIVLAALPWLLRDRFSSEDPGDH